MGSSDRPRRGGQWHVPQLVVRCGISRSCFVSCQPKKVHRTRSLDRLVQLLDRTPPPVKSKLLVVELWGLGDLVIATPFLHAASEHYDVTLLAKPYAKDLQARFWGRVK